MAKDTVLAIVQSILGDADGDLVNSISDTVESLQCSEIVKDSFDQIVEGYDLALHNSLQKLTATSSTTPTVMERPEGFYNIQWVKYDSKNAAADDQLYRPINYVAYLPTHARQLDYRGHDVGRLRSRCTGRERPSPHLLHSTRWVR